MRIMAQQGLFFCTEEICQVIFGPFKVRIVLFSDILTCYFIYNENVPYDMEPGTDAVFL